MDRLKTKIAALGGTQKNEWMVERIKERECGECTFCCTAKSIEDMVPIKPAWKRCKELCIAGCGIYKTKPETCADYFCAWRLGLGEDSARPDKVGAMVDVDVIHGETTAGITVHAKGAYDHDEVAGMINDGRRLGIAMVGFASEEDDSVPTMLQYTDEPEWIVGRLRSHSGDGKTGWNRPVAEE